MENERLKVLLGSTIDLLKTKTCFERYELKEYLKYEIGITEEEFNLIYGTNLEIIVKRNQLVRDIINNCVWDNQLKILELKLEELFEDDLVKFEAMVELESIAGWEDEKDIGILLWIYRILDQVVFYPGVKNYEELGKRLLEDDGIISKYWYEVLVDYIDFEGYAKDYESSSPKKKGFISSGYIELT